MQTNISERHYIPKVGELIKMREWLDYTSHGLPLWTNLRVDAVETDYILAHHAPSPLDRTKDEPAQYKLTYTSIQPPLGWEPRYTIYCSPAQALTVVNDWFRRGIVVRANHNIGDTGGSTFQPLDNSAQPDWKHIQVTDALSAEDCPKLFRVVAVESEEINYRSNPQHPNLRAMDRTARGRAIKHMEADGWKVCYVRYGGGYWTRRRQRIIHDWSEK